MMSFARRTSWQEKKQTKGRRRKSDNKEVMEEAACEPTFWKISFTSHQNRQKISTGDEEPHSSLNVYHRNKNTHYLQNERYAHIIVYFIIVCDERRCRRATTVLFFFFFFFFFSVFVDEDERISKIHHHEQIWKKRKRTPPSVVKRSSQEYEE